MYSPTATEKPAIDPSLISERDFALDRLSQPGVDYETAFVNLGRLLYVLEEAPDAAHGRTIRVLAGVLNRKEHAHRKQCYFLYKKAGEALARVLDQCPGPERKKSAWRALEESLCKARGHVHRAVAEATGSLPLGTQGKAPEIQTARPFPEIDWDSLTGAEPGSTQALGRTLVVSQNGRVLVVKFLREGEDPQSLAAEAAWMEAMARSPEAKGAGWEVPRPLKTKGSFVFSVTGTPSGALDGQALHAGSLAMAYKTRPAYFSYPNHGPGLASKETFLEILSKNAFILGACARRGLVHTAPIPLFHNRIQAFRRDDHGLYRWPRAGRLDRWLESCRFPNICALGPRDYEHFEAFKGPDRELYEQVGTQVLSLILVAGSWFREKDPGRLGQDAQGNPVDARELFEEKFFCQLVEGIFFSYYEGFCGQPFSGTLPKSVEGLVAASIDQMGVDRHMDEFLRARDQEGMDKGDFTAFLISHNWDPRRAETQKRGKEDIALITGPHLGGFNQPISLPELTEFTATAAALCVAGKFWVQNKKAGGPGPDLPHSTA